MSAGVAAPAREGRPFWQKRSSIRARVSPHAGGSPPGDPPDGRLTLEQRLDGVWEGLRVTGTAECPVCHGELIAAPAAPAPAGTTARCARCRSTLS